MRLEAAYCSSSRSCYHYMRTLAEHASQQLTTCAIVEFSLLAGAVTGLLFTGSSFEPVLDS